MKTIGYGNLTDKVFLGTISKDGTHWVGDKQDVTNDFLHVLNQFIPVNTTRTISVSNGEQILYMAINNTNECIDKAIKHLINLRDNKDE